MTSRSTAGAARVENIQRFLNDFPGAQTIRLEQNYRSTATSLARRTPLIENNTGVWVKSCGPTAPTASRSALLRANELDEARFVVNRIKTRQDNESMLAQCAILSQQRPVARAGRSVITGQYAVPHLRRYALLRTP